MVAPSYNPVRMSDDSCRAGGLTGGSSQFHYQNGFHYLLPEAMSSWKKRTIVAGTWALAHQSRSQHLTRVDAVALWHINMSTLSFADGHADSHKWRGPAMLEASKAAPRSSKFGQTAKQMQTSKTFGMKYGYAHKRSAQFEEKWARIGFRPSISESEKAPS